jgi:nitroreductase
VDTFLAIASKREVRTYADRPLPEEVERRILEAGRITGSSRNRQSWRFDVVASPEVRERVAAALWRPENARGAALVVAVVVFGKGPTGFDAGRAAQDMMLAAANDGVGSCPNGAADPEALRAALGLGADEQVATVLTFGFPATPRDPASRPPEAWIAAADRKPLDEVVRRL